MDLQGSGTAVREVDDEVVGSAHDAGKDEALHVSSNQLASDRHRYVETIRRET